MYIWQNMINALSRIINSSQSSNEDIEGNFVFIHLKMIE